MCFSQSQSYINAILLSSAAIYLYKTPILSIGLFFLAFKDWLQGQLYKYHGNPKLQQIFGSLSWYHISFQPLFVNLIFAFFSPQNHYYWNFVFFICILYAIFNILSLKDFELYNRPSCHIGNTADSDLCSQTTQSYMGKYHVGYMFNRNTNFSLYFVFYCLIMFIPALFTQAAFLNIAWLIFVALIAFLYRDTKGGENAAIWCYSAILFFLPVCLAHKEVFKFLSKYKNVSKNMQFTNLIIILIGLLLYFLLDERQHHF